MSATINQKQFSDYFGGAPVIEIPGYARVTSHFVFATADDKRCRFTHPVQDHYLESYLPTLISSYKLQATAKPARKATQAQIDRMHSSFIEEGVSERDIKSLGTLENLSRAEKIDFNVVGATVSHLSVPRPMESAQYQSCIAPSIGRLLPGQIARRWRRCPRFRQWSHGDLAKYCRHPSSRLIHHVEFTPRSPLARQPNDCRTNSRLPPYTSRQAQGRGRHECS